MLVLRGRDGPRFGRREGPPGPRRGERHSGPPASSSAFSAFPRLCHPSDTLLDCAACWTQVYANAVAPYSVRIEDDATRQALSPGPADAGATAMWTVTPGAVSFAAGRNTNPAEYPDSATGYGIGPEDVPGTTFHLQLQPSAGVWIVEGNMDTAGATTADCASHDGRKTSLVVVGDMTTTTNQLTLRPASAKGYALLVGRDMRMTTGNTTFSTCATGGAVMRNPGAMPASSTCSMSRR